ncbi:MAG: Ig-like domain-containing protein [Sulfurimonadaceae bacterium]
MKHLLILLLLVTGSISLYGSSDDLTTSKGTDQEVIVLLSPSVAQTDVWNNAKIEVSFSVPLDASSVQKNNIKLTHLSSKTNNHMDGIIEYDKFDNKLTFTPNAPLLQGVYEVEIKSLKAEKAYKTTQINEIKYRFNVPEVINGHQLPPEPDPTINNSTLLGIDANGNGVRDDVERLIIIEEAKNDKYPKTHTAISLQYAWAWQKMIENPVLESRKYLEKASACQWYWFNKKTKSIKGFSESLQWVKSHSGRLGVDLEDKIFNTKERIQQRFKFNEACSGNIFKSAEKNIDACRINIDELGE